jgi:glycosyltransferase involved in cell wall biosynthesis
MPKISGVVIAHNEEKYIARCIRSLQAVADEVVVVDSGSTDRTTEICRELGVRLYRQDFLGYVEQKNHAVSLAAYDHILSLDADEAISRPMAEAILEIKKNWTHDGYVFPRMNCFCGRWMRYTNLYPDRKLRLFDRRRAAWGGVNPHDKVVLANGASSRQVKAPLLHWMCDSLEEQLEKNNRFSTIAARAADDNGTRASFRKLVLHPFWRFIHNFVVKGGFLEGRHGFVVSWFSAMLCFEKYAKLRALQDRKRFPSKRTGMERRAVVAGEDARLAGSV